MAYRHERFRDPGLHDAVQLFVKYIPLEFDENCLYELFMEYGEVTNVHIPEKAYMLGHEYLFGFVSYLTTDEALDAINALNGKAPYYISVEVSRQATVELLRDQTHAFHSAPKCTEVVPTFRRHSNIRCNYKLTTTPDGKRVIQGIHSGVPRRSVPFGDRNSAVVRDLSEEDDVPAPGQKQKFPCYKCGNLTFRKCVCGGAYYCKEACRMSDWPEHKQNCIKKLESQPDFQAGASTGFLQNRSINIEMQKTHLSSRHLKTESFNNTVGQLENGLQSEQRENLSHNLGHRQPRFPAVNNFADSQIEVAGVRNNGKRHSRFPICDLDVQNEISADKKENSNKGSLNVAVNKDGDNRRNFNQRDGDNGRNLNQRDGDNGRNLDQRDGDNKRNLDQRDGDKRRNLDQHNGDIRRNFDQRNGDNRRNFDQRNGDNRRNFIQRDGDNRRNFIQRDGDNRRNFIQRDGDNRRNFNQHDGDKNKFGDGNARKNFVARDQKSFSGGMNKKKINDCKGKYLDGSVPTNNTESEECWGQPEEDVSQKVEEKQDNLVDKHGKIQDTVVEADDKTSHLALSSSENLTAEVAKVMVVMKEGPTTYFVQRLANKETLKIICSEIIKSPSLPLVKPEVGVLCASMFEGEWYRARVLMLDPQLAVQYVDYGNVDICDPTKLHELPQSIAGFPPMAEKVEFDDKTPAEVCAELFDGAIISIKLTGKTENGALKVTKDNGNNAVLAIQNSSASLSQDDSAKDAQHISTSSLQAEETPTFPNVSPAANVSAFSTSDAETIELVDSAVETDRLSVAIKAVVIMKEGPKTYFIQQLANNDKLKLICEEVVKSPSLPLVKPEVGMLCAAMFEGEWYRARVLLLDPQLAVQYIDYGNIDICDPARLHELPQSIVDFPPMAEKIEFVDETQELSDGCIISVMPTGETENGVMKVRFDDGKKAFSTHVASSVPPQSDSTAKESQQASAASVQVSTSQAETSKSVVTPSYADNLSPVATLLQVVCASSASVEIPNEEKAFAKAKITVLNDSMDYWVTWEHNLETVDKIILKTNENITSTPLENPEVGLLCAAKFDGIWFRAHIVKISPEVQVHYLDYGNYEICTNNDLRDLPEALKDLPPMAFRVQLAEGTPQEYHSLLPEEFLSIRVVEQREAGVSVVQVEGVKYAGGVTADMLPAATNTVPSSVPSSSQENVTSIPSTTNAQVEKSTIPKSPHCEPSANSSANVPVNMINAPKFYDVRVAVTVGDKDYWVQRVNRDKELQFVMVQVNDYASKCIRMTPEVGKLCATEFLGLWYRARITKVAPEVEVHFIDFGNTEIRKKDEILEMPESVQEVSPLALRIRLADGTPAKFSNLQVDSIISVKPFMKTSDSVIVLVEGVEYAMDSEETTSQDVTSTVCASLEKQPEPGSSKTDFQNTCLKFLIAEGNNGGALHFMKKYSDHYTVTAVTDASRSVYDKLIELRRSGFDFPTEKSFKPAVGDVVLAQSPSQEGMCRARIVSESWGSYRTMLLDCGIIENVTDMRKLPPYLAALPTFAVKCVITSYHVEEEEFLSKCAKSEDAFIFQVMSVKDNQVTCLVLSILNIPLCSVVLSTWQPGLEEVGISCVALRDGDPVRMSFFSGPENVFVTSLVPEHMQQFSTFSDTLHAYCLQAGCLQQPPRVGDLFAHKYVDDNKFYRCQVLSVTGLFCDIFYIDFGDSEFGVLCDKLKYISEDLKKFPCQCLQVCLKDVGSCKMTFGLIHFIKKLVDESTVLLMEKHPDGVILQTERGISVNETIVTILDNVNDTTDAAADTSAPNSSVECKLVSNTTKNSSTARPPVTSVQSSVIQNHLPDHKHDLNKRIVSSALKHRTFPIGELKLCILSILKDLSLMACPCDPSAAEAVENLTGSLNDYCSIRPVEPYYPQVDEVCIAKFHADGLWYRAVCLVANPNISTRKMIFVDYGNVEDIEVDGIRRMEPQFLELPVLVEKCNIEGVDARNKLVEKIVRETIVTNRLYNVRITKHLSTHYVMDVPQVTVALRAEGLC